MPYPFMTVGVFAEQRFGGNPLAVVHEAAGLSDAEMQSLAAEFNLSETTFVLPPQNPANSARVRIFNRTYEMPFAGHPNVGTAFVLSHLGLARGDELRFQEIAGIVTVRIERDGEGAPVGATIDAPQPLSVGVEIPAPRVAECVGLAPADVVTAQHQPVRASVGMPFVIAEVAREALARAAPDVAAFRRVLAATPALDGNFPLYLYARDGAEVRARMFDPVADTVEDPATGSAATALAAFLLSHSGRDAAEYTIRQGSEVGRPSTLYASARRGADGVRASMRGRCAPVLQGEVIALTA
jgi:trans-2,3-dihydro-3-hydroxyanthranilate isomerase